MKGWRPVLGVFPDALVHAEKGYGARMAGGVAGVRGCVDDDPINPPKPWPLVRWIF